MGTAQALTFQQTSSASTSCAHCGLPVGGTHSAEEGPQFCCYGCMIAFDVLGSNANGERGGRTAMLRLGIGIVLGINVMMFSMPLYVESLVDFLRQGGEEYFSLLKWLLLALSTPVFFLLGIPFIESALARLRGQSAASTDLLIAIGVSAAFLVSMVDTIIGTGPVYYETAIAILVIVTAGRYLEARTRWRALKVTGELRSSIVGTARVRHDGMFNDVLIDDLNDNDIILLAPGEASPIDGVILDGAASMSVAHITGESHPQIMSVGAEVLAGSINLDGRLLLRVSRPVETSYVARMEALLNEAKLGKANIELVADKVSRVAVPVIIAIALASLGYWWSVDGFQKGLFTALSVLLIACPCALGIATPAALSIAVSRAAGRGILFHNLSALEHLAKIKSAFFDKTGTLTRGEPEIIGVEVIEDAVDRHFAGDRSSMLAAVGSLEHGSRHPLAKAVATAFADCDAFSTLSRIHEFSEVAGQGVIGRIDEKWLRVGRASFVGKHHDVDSEDMSTVWCGVSDSRESHDVDVTCVFRMRDQVRPDALPAITGLAALGIDSTILSGDNNRIVGDLAHDLDIQYKAELSPDQKVLIVKSAAHSLFVGDGLNDAAAIAVASVGVAMGTGADISRGNADVTLLSSKLEQLPMLIRLSRKTMRVVRQNLVWAFGYNAIGVVIAAMGLLNPILSAVAMALSSLAVIQNSLRVRTEFTESQSGIAQRA